MEIQTNRFNMLIIELCLTVWVHIKSLLYQQVYNILNFFFLHGVIAENLISDLDQWTS